MEGSRIIKKEGVEKLVECLLQDSALSSACSNLQWLILIAVDLRIDVYLIKKIKEELKLKKLTVKEALLEILYKWTAQNGEDATVDKFISAFSANGLQVNLAAFLSDHSVTEVFETEKQDNGDEIQEESEISQTNIKEQTDVSFKNIALLNSVVLEKVVKNLNFNEWKNLRLVNSQLYNATLSFWRRSTRIVIYQTSDFYRKKLCMEDFSRLFDHPLYNLTEYPYRRYILKENTLGMSQCENTFWQVCGSKITHLTLSGCANFGKGGMLGLLQLLLLKTCPNLEDVHMESRSSYFPGETANVEELTNGMVAKNLKILRLDESWEAHDISAILKYAPNVTELTVGREASLEGLLQPTISGKHVKLTKLRLWAWSITSFSLLRRYVQMYPKSITSISINTVNLRRGARVEPYNLYSALARCRNLASLELVTEQDNDYHGGKETKWFMDLSVIPFLKLKELTVQLKHYPMSFDFHNLGGMPNLEKLSVEFDPDRDCFKTTESVTHKWFFDGDRVFSPKGIPGIRFRSLVCCNKLKQLVLHIGSGHYLYINDIKHFSNWFPNLEHLEAALTGETLPLVYQKFRNISSLVVTRSNFKMDLNNLYHAKKNHENVRLFYHSSDFGKVEVLKTRDRGVVLEKSL